MIYNKLKIDIEPNLSILEQNKLLKNIKSNFNINDFFVPINEYDDYDDFHCIATICLNYKYKTIVNYCLSKVNIVDSKKLYNSSFLYELSKSDLIHSVDIELCNESNLSNLLAYYLIFNCLKADFDKEKMQLANLDSVFIQLINSSQGVKQFDFFINNYATKKTIADKYFLDEKYFIRHKDYFQEKKKIYYTFLEKDCVNQAIKNTSLVENKKNLLKL